MTKKLQFIWLIFCLGSFLIPKQVFSVQKKEEMSCCKKEKTEKSCCNKSEQKHPCEKKESHNSPCQGNCNGCKTCSPSVVYLGIEPQNQMNTHANYLHTNQIASFYLQPHISQLMREIWQPPKIS